METEKQPEKFQVIDKAENRFHIFGKTTIDHRIRRNLFLTNDEYVLMELLKSVQDMTTWRITYGELWKKCGITKQELIPLWKSLKEKGMVYKHETGIITTSQKWDDAFAARGDFMGFWKIAPKGNKEKARTMYNRAIKVIEHKVLCETYKKYTDNCIAAGTYLKDTSSWLNPQYKHWEDQLTKPVKKDDIPAKTTTLETEF